MKKVSFLFFPFLLVPVITIGTPPLPDPHLENLIDFVRNKKLDQDPYWLKLLHMRRTWRGSYKSDIDGSGFFLSSQGRTNPKAELEATLRSFFDPLSEDSDQEHPQCRFPARFSWLNETLPNLGAPKVECSRFENWKEKLNPSKVSLVFASYYMNNPASMYGHTFLRLHRKGKEGEAHLLDYTINFSANTTTSNGILFALLGLTGGFRGVFSTEPYYVKVQKYNNFESRDLWEYELNIDSAGQDRLVRHLWEMGHTSIAYYFFNKNCSYQLLPMLEVARPDLDLSRPFSVRAIPLDTLRSVLKKPGLVEKTNFRASHLRRLRFARENLMLEEFAIAEDMVRNPSADLESRFGQLSNNRRSLVLDAAYEYLRYRSGFYREQPAAIKETEHRLLTMRNQYSAPVYPSVQTIPSSTPESAHNTGLIGFGFGADKFTSFEEISLRGALHDLESNPEGFVEGSQLEMFSARIRHNNKRGTTYLEEGTLVQVKSLSAWEPWIRVPSWGVKIGFENAHDLDRTPEDSLYFGISGGSGITLRIPQIRRGLWYALVNGDSGVGGIFDNGYRVGIGGSSGVIFNPTDPWRVHFSAGFTRFGLGNAGSSRRLQITQSIGLTKNTEVRLTCERENSHQEAHLKLNQFF